MSQATVLDKHPVGDEKKSISENAQHTKPTSSEDHMTFHVCQPRERELKATVGTVKYSTQTLHGTLSVLYLYDFMHHAAATWLAD